MVDTSIRISSGKYVDLADFKSEDICLESITKSLNNIKRFTGHWKVKEPITVAQHTGLTMKISRELYPLDVPTYLMCMIHDMPEAYYGDHSSPLKRYLGDNLKTLKQIDKVVRDELFFFGPEYVAVAYDRMKLCDHISLRIEQTNMWGGYDYNINDKYEDEAVQFIGDYPIWDWFDDVTDRYLHLNSTYLALKQRNESMVA